MSCKNDMLRVQEILQGYNSDKAAHMGFASNGKNREFIMGGNAQILAAGLAELLVNLTASAAVDTEAFLASFIDVVREGLREGMYEGAEQTGDGAPPLHQEDARGQKWMN